MDKRAEKKAAKNAAREAHARYAAGIRNARVPATSKDQACFTTEPPEWRVRVFDNENGTARVMVADDDDLYIERDVPLDKALEIFELLTNSGPLSHADAHFAVRENDIVVRRKRR